MEASPLQIGCWLNLPSPEAAEIVGATGFDFVIIDLEHSVIGMETASRMMMALGDTPAIVRIPEPSDGWIKRTLDAGAAAVMVPRVEDLETAKRLAASATYGPEGRRGEGAGIARAAAWGRTAPAYRSRWREKGGLVLQIESPAGLAIAPEIATLPGVTQLFFGPSDFSACLGCDRADPRIAAAGREVARIARAAGLEAGTVTYPAGSFPELAALGYTHALDVSEISLLIAALDTHLAAARRILAHVDPENGQG